jgi:hypothetical protein
LVAVALELQPQQGLWVQMAEILYFLLLPLMVAAVVLELIQQPEEMAVRAAAENKVEQLDLQD